jgi:nucleotide-binding universal stress UspA family protein
LKARKDGKYPYMYKHILLPTDGSDLSKQAIRHGITLAKTLGARVTALVVSTPFHTLVVDPTLVLNALEQYKQLVADHTAKYLAVVRDQASASGVSCDVMQIEHEQPYEAIIDTAKRSGCDLIIMASHGLRGTSAIVLGSETLKVLTHTDIAVLVVR